MKYDDYFRAKQNYCEINYAVRDKSTILALQASGGAAPKNVLDYALQTQVNSGKLLFWNTLWRFLTNLKDNDLEEFVYYRW